MDDAIRVMKPWVCRDVDAVEKDIAMLLGIVKVRMPLEKNECLQFARRGLQKRMLNQDTGKENES